MKSESWESGPRFDAHMLQASRADATKYKYAGSTTGHVQALHAYLKPVGGRLALSAVQTHSTQFKCADNQHYSARH